MPYELIRQTAADPLDATTITLLVASLGTLVTAIGGAAVLIINALRADVKQVRADVGEDVKVVRKDIEEVHALVNSKMDAMREAAFAAGRAEGSEAERVKGEAKAAALVSRGLGEEAARAEGVITGTARAEARAANLVPATPEPAAGTMQITGTVQGEMTGTATGREPPDLDRTS